MNMHAPLIPENVRLYADAHDPRERHQMNAPLLMLEIQANALEQERRNRRLMNEQLQIARLHHRNENGGVMMVIRNKIGSMLVNAGERLRHDAASADTAMTA